MKWSPNLAYVVGLLVTDGNVSKDGRHIIMRSSDIDLLEVFKFCLELKTSIRQSYNNGFAKKPSYRVQFSDAKFYRWLLTIGLFPAKTYTIGAIDVPNEFFRDFLRGHLDGDGSIYRYLDQYGNYKGRIYSNNRIYSKFISVSEVHIKWLFKKIQELTPVKGALYCTLKTKGVPMWSIKFSKKETLKLLGCIYYSEGLPCLERKRNLAVTIMKTIPRETRKPWTKVIS